MARKTTPKALAKPPARPKKPSRIAAAAAKALIEGRVAIAAATRPRVEEPATPPPAAPKVNAVRVLTAENAKLSAQVETLSADNKSALAAAERALKQVEALAESDRRQKEEVRKLQEQLSAAKAEIAQLQAQNTPREGPLVLTADSVSTLLQEFVASFEGKLGPLQLGGSEIKLRAGFAQAAGKAAFVVPSATAPKDAVEGLHEIRLQLDPRTSKV